jgi:Cu/Zn superoxide dismutase
VNVHTAANPGGEIRGQVLLASGAELEARLTAQQEIPTNLSTALGTATLTLTSEGLAFALTVDGLTGPITAAHFHRAPPGVNGGVVRTITGDFIGNTATGVWKSSDAEPLTAALITELLKGNLYLNVHTAANPGGEIRGQVRLAGGDGRGAVLAAGNEVPPANSVGIGCASMTLTDQGLIFRLSANELTSALIAAHFHNAPFGVNGPVVRPITGDFAALTADGVWTPADASPLTSALIGELVQDNIYLNLHTTNNPGGEIRGQSGSRTISGVDEPNGSGRFSLANAPNPVLGRTSFSFFLPSEADVSLKLFDLAGREVATVFHGPRGAGWNHATFATRQLKAGVYVYRLRAGMLSQARKMLVLQ